VGTLCLLLGGVSEADRKAFWGLWKIEVEERGLVG